MYADIMPGSESLSHLYASQRALGRAIDRMTTSEPVVAGKANTWQRVGHLLDNALEDVDVAIAKMQQIENILRPVTCIELDATRSALAAFDPAKAEAIHSAFGESS